MDPYATHQPILAMAAANVTALWPELPFLELGCGDYSTPLLTAIHGRPHTVWASNKAWLDKYRYPMTYLVDNWAEVDFSQHLWGLVFVDNEENSKLRALRVAAALKHAKVVVTHDAHWPIEAKWQFVDDRSPPTGIYSDKHDITSWPDVFKP